MASSDTTELEFHEQFKDITECCICTETYTDPRVLPCIHTFCMRCLEAVGVKSAKKPGDVMPCPICRQQFKIPGEGFTGIQKNFFMTKLVEMSKFFSHSSTKTKCDECLEELGSDTTTEVPVAENFCKDCCQKLCSDCSRHHRKSKLTKTHELVSVESETAIGEMIEKLMPETCQKHTGERLKIYCRDCKDIVCALCFIESHQNHRWLDVDKAAEEFRQQNQENVRDLLNYGDKMSEKKKKLEETRNETIEKADLLEVTVIETIYELKEMIDKHGNSLLAEVGAIKQRRLDEIKKQIQYIDEEMSNLESYKVYCDEVTSKGSASDICRMISGLVTRSNKLMETQKWIIERRISPFAFGIERTKLDDFLKDDGENFIGRIGEFIHEPSDRSDKELFDDIIPEIENRSQTTNKDDMKMKRNKAKKSAKKKVNDNKSQKLILLHDASSTGTSQRTTPISGLAIIKQELFITREFSPTIEVYNSFSFTFQRSLLLSKLQNPSDIVGVSGPIEYLYILDSSDEKKIYQVSSSGAIMSSWLIGSNAVRLSVTSESYVLVNFVNNKKLKEYKKDLCTHVHSLVQQTNLSVCCNHSVKLNSGHFIVCGDALPGIFLLDKEGNTQKAFYGKIGSTVESLKNPFQLIIVRAGKIIVLDKGTKQVFLLDLNLNFQRELLSAQDGLSNTGSMVFDQSTDRLFISDQDFTSNWGILVFKITL